MFPPKLFICNHGLVNVRSLYYLWINRLNVSLAELAVNVNYSSLDMLLSISFAKVESAIWKPGSSVSAGIYSTIL